jgi:hypothetical protein
MSTENQNQITDATEGCAAAAGYAPRRRKLSPALAAWLLPAMAMAGCFRTSAYRERHDPNRPKTKADLDAIAAAEAKRQRRAAKRAAHTIKLTYDHRENRLRNH